MSKTLDEVMIEKVPCSFIQQIFDKGTFEGKPNTKYATTLIFNPKDKRQKKIIKMLDKQVEELLETELDGEEPEKKLLCLKRDKHRTKRGNRPEYQGMVTLRVSNERRPIAIDQNMEPVTAEDGLFYSGCLVNAKVSFWANNGGAGPVIGCNLIAIQFAGHGDALGEGTVTPEEAMEGFGEVDVKGAFGG